MSVGAASLSGMGSMFDPPAVGVRVGRYPIEGLVRRARRIAGLSQRSMARFARTSPATVGRVESGSLTPSVDLLERLLGAAGLYLAVVDQDGRVILPMETWDDTLDGAERRYPAHLDTILDPGPEDNWWGDIYGLLRPPETFHRSRVDRDARRRRSRWEVRAAKFRGVPPPPWGDDSY
jgi:transcriptional regulator with XRE-family HTH domain